jgi:SPP1 gp7 family putative phage head morphogenesis protein
VTAAPDAIAERTSPAIARAVYDLWRAHLVRGTDTEPYVEALARAAGEPLAVAHVLGRYDLLRQLRNPRRRLFSRLDYLGIAPTFWDAIYSLLARDPMLATEEDSVAQIVADGGIAFARAADLTVSKKARDAIAGAIQGGESEIEAVQRLRRDTSWSRAYSLTAYRTTALRSYTDGLEAQASDPRLDGAVAGWRYSATMDRDTRHNHARLHGLVGALDDPLWRVIGPPAGFACRCTRQIVTREEAERLFPDGRIPPMVLPRGGGPDPGFVAGAGEGG